MIVSSEAPYGNRIDPESGLSLGDFDADGKTHLPALGEHTAEFLSELGYSEDAVRELFDRAIVR